MPSLSPAQVLSNAFRRNRQCYEINPPEQQHNVVYLGNVLTVMAKGEQSVERPLQAIWRSYSCRKRDMAMKLNVTRQGLKLETKQLGLTEYWAHRVTYCYAPPDYPRVFCWVYKHEGKRMKPELRCHAVLCRKQNEPAKIVETLQNYLHTALQEYKREKLAMEKARKSVTGGNGELLPRRKLLLQTGALNFRPPVNRSKSAPRLGSIDEEDEHEEPESGRLQDPGASVSDYEFDEGSDGESFGYRETPLLGGGSSAESGSLCPDDQLSSTSSCSSTNNSIRSSASSAARSPPEAAEGDEEVQCQTFGPRFLRRQLSLSSACRRRFAQQRPVPSAVTSDGHGCSMESGDGQEDEMNNRATVSDNSYTALSMLRIGEDATDFTTCSPQVHSIGSATSVQTFGSQPAGSLDSGLASDEADLKPVSGPHNFEDVNNNNDRHAVSPAEQVRLILLQSSQVTAL